MVFLVDKKIGIFLFNAKLKQEYAKSLMDESILK